MPPPGPQTERVLILSKMLNKKSKIRREFLLINNV